MRPHCTSSVRQVVLPRCSKRIFLREPALLRLRTTRRSWSWWDEAACSGLGVRVVNWIRVNGISVFWIRVVTLQYCQNYSGLGVRVLWKLLRAVVGTKMVPHAAADSFCAYPVVNRFRVPVERILCIVCHNASRGTIYKNITITHRCLCVYIYI